MLLAGGVGDRPIKICVIKHTLYTGSHMKFQVENNNFKPRAVISFPRYIGTSPEEEKNCLSFKYGHKVNVSKINHEMKISGQVSKYNNHVSQKRMRKVEIFSYCYIIPQYHMVIMLS